MARKISERSVLREYNVTLSLGIAARPGSIVDGIDRSFLKELEIQEELMHRSLEAGVQVVVEGFGHLAINMIPWIMNLYSVKFPNIPLRLLSVPTDVAMGYDHISGAICGAVAAALGAEMMTVITKAEHVGLPRIEDIVEGLKTFRIAAHIADIAKNGDLSKDKRISITRNKVDWKSVFQESMFPEDARELHSTLNRNSSSFGGCSMCGSLCALKIVDKFLS